MLNIKKIKDLIFISILILISSCGGGGSSNDNPGKTSLQAPAGTNATDGTYTNYIIISWNPVSNATGYTIYRGTSSATSNTFVNTSSSPYYVDTSATQNTHYWYTITANDNTNTYSESAKSTGEEGWSSNTGSSITTPLTIILSEGTYPNYVHIYWGVIIGAEHYNIYRATSSSGSFTNVGSSTSEEFDDLSITPNTHYWYMVTAVDSSGIESYKRGWGSEGWADSASTVYTFRLINGSVGFISMTIQTSTGSNTWSNLEPNAIRKVTYTSKPVSIAWSANSSNTGLGSSLSWSGTYSPSTELTHTTTLVLDIAYFSLWIKNSSSNTWNRFYFNSTTTYSTINHAPDSSSYQWYGFFAPNLTSNYWQTTVGTTNFWKWGSSFPGGGGANYSVYMNSYGSYYVDCEGGN